ncbi:uncharacterized protein KQ657_002686 [Scheffersomyces spartinae]|uniref:Major facilitator superfamily (MFS) profile domain-containing protein n=1 Tax=Scheffersomyces spartinae TaxID=45513 RepID=A0A9P7V5Z2_9ASCO|nr:uncharacterized protein KQ657_002686 [Scheffersomyces spartinae]KAG7191897.1 hypothetical protein KQ657_002686 [Scheffersomyces spartinae]
MTEADIVPGTVHLVDIEGFLHVKKETGSKHNIILVPQPTSNPNDPLRWSKTKKNLQFLLVWFWAFMLAVSVAFFGSLYGVWISEEGYTIVKLNNMVGLLYAFLGIGVITLQPTAMKLGRRFVYLICSVISLVALAVGGSAKSIAYLYAYGILSGYSAAPVDSLVEISVTDTFFKHETATYLGYVLLALYAGSFLGPTAAGFIVEKHSWRWTYWTQIIIIGVTFIVQIFCMRETLFSRLRYTKNDNLEDNILSQIQSHVSGALPEESEKQYSAETDNVSLSQDIENMGEVDPTIAPRTYMEKLKPYEITYNDERSWLVIFLRPFVCYFPGIIYGALVYGAQIAWLSLLTTTQATLFGAPPYNFAPDMVGTTGVAAFIGATFGMLYGGKFSDYLIIRLSERNKGVFEPEFRLWAMIIPTLINAAGILAYGLGINNGVHWAIPVIIGKGFLGFSMSATGSITLTYAIDCYPKMASDAFVLMLFIRNCIGCGFTFGFEHWLIACGLSQLTWLLFMISIIINGSFIFFLKWGKDFRRMTAKRYLRLAKTGGSTH